MGGIYTRTHDIDALESALATQLADHGSADAPPRTASAVQRPTPARPRLRQRVGHFARQRIAASPWLRRPAGILWAFLKGWEFRVHTSARIDELQKALAAQQREQDAERQRLAAAQRREVLQLRLEINRLSGQLRRHERTLERIDSQS